VGILAHEKYWSYSRKQTIYFIGGLTMMNTVDENVVDVNANEVEDVVVCDYNKLGFTDGCKLIGRSIKRNAKRVAIGAGVVTAVGVGALVAHALKKHDDDGNDAIVDSTARDLDVYETPSVSHDTYCDFYEGSTEKLDEAVAGFDTTEVQDTQETTENE
jgi:hypothetical protein